MKPWERRRICALVGHYGSGKTELALNLALDARRAGRDVILVDLDIVNPFFRSAELHETLRAQGVRLIAPPYALTGVDLPVLPASVMRVFEEKGARVILDVGGDDAGAAALGLYKAKFDAEPAELLYLVNPYRPFSDTPEKVIDLLRRIEARARIPVTGLVNNANLAQFTTREELLRGRELLRAVTEKTGIETLFATGEERVLRELGDLGVPLFPLRRYLRPAWAEDGDRA